VDEGDVEAGDGSPRDAPVHLAPMKPKPIRPTRQRGADALADAGRLRHCGTHPTPSPPSQNVVPAWDQLAELLGAAVRRLEDDLQQSLADVGSGQGPSERGVDALHLGGRRLRRANSRASTPSRPG
jgi:hypothetical protein